MDNFTDSKKHKKITSIDDCLQPDSITENLWAWAKRLENLGELLFCIIILSGIIIAISTSIITTEVEYGSYYKYSYTETTFSFGVFIAAIAQTALYAFIEYCVYHALALLIGALANITQNTKTTAKLTEYIARKTLKEEEPDHKEPEHEETEHEETEHEETEHEETETKCQLIETTWKCRGCGYINSYTAKFCIKCGTRREN